MADEIALNIMEGFDTDKWRSFMFTRSTGYPSGNWGDITKAFNRAVVQNQHFDNKDYYDGRPYLPIAGCCLINWSE